MASRGRKLPLGEAGQAENASGGAGLHDPVFCLCFRQESFGSLASGAQFAARVASNPSAVILAEPLPGVSALTRKFSNASEGGRRFLGGETLGPKQRLCIVGLQLEPPARSRKHGRRMS